MERWYIACNTFGLPREILTNLVQAVRHYQLGDVVTRFCYEKGAGGKRGQFYVFIGVVSEQKGILPPALHASFSAMLRSLRLTDHKLYVYFDEVKRMVDKELEIHNLRQIKMVQFRTLAPSDPFSYVRREPSDLPTTDATRAYTKLLYWLSAYGRGTWNQFRTTCTELGLDPNGQRSRRIMRRLRSLGHVELTSDGQTWAIAPPCLVVTDVNTDQYCTFLAGQRSHLLLKELTNIAFIETELHPYADAPEIVRATFNSRATAEALAKSLAHHQYSLHLAGRSSLEIASRLPQLAAWEASLPVLAVVKGNYTYEQWMAGRFYPIQLPQETGLYRLTHVSTRFEHPQLTLLYDAEHDTWRKGDWYGLRYLMLRRTGECCTFHYDHQHHTLALAADQRVPDMYERCLVLASGKLPTFDAGQVVFGGVSEPLAHLLATTLEATLIEHGGV